MCRLETLPAGPVILCGHSMGGLLAADASTSPNHAASKRVIGLIGYDVPFLGMHPHVVISGIASLLPHKHKETAGHGTDGNSARLRTEKEMNDERHVNIPSPVELLCEQIFLPATMCWLTNSQHHRQVPHKYL